jgi:hypothetical protein
VSSPPPPSWLADPAQWPPAWRPAQTAKLIGLFRAFVTDHRVKLKRSWRGLVKEPPDSDRFPGWTEAEDEYALERLIIAALFYNFCDETRITRNGRIGPDWTGLSVGVERVRARDEKEAHAKGVLYNVLAASMWAYGKPRVKVALTLTNLATGQRLSPREARTAATILSKQASKN